MTDHYSIFGVTSDASDKEVQRSYYKAIRKFHSDTGEKTAESKAMAQRITNAYEQIKALRKGSPKPIQINEPAPLDLISRFKAVANGYLSYKNACNDMGQSIKTAKQTLREKFSGPSAHYEHRFHNIEQRQKAERILQILPLEIEGDRDLHTLADNITSIFKDIKSAKEGRTNAEFKHLNAAFLTKTEDAYNKLILPRQSTIAVGLAVLRGEKDQFKCEF